MNYKIKFLLNPLKYVVQKSFKCNIIDKRPFKLYIPPLFHDIQMPKENKLPAMNPEPLSTINETSVMKMKKKMEHIRGPETIHNSFLYKQYGIIALNGVQLHIGHINMIRTYINKYMNTKTFAVWRIPEPWKPVTKRNPGKKSGGGKANIAFYVIPIKAGRVILEVGGKIEYEEVQHVLERVASKLPCHALATSYERLLQIKENNEKNKLLNINPITKERVIKYSLGNSEKIMTFYDKKWDFHFENI